MNNKRPNRFQPRFTDGEHAQLRKLAAERGVSPTRFIEDAVRGMLSRERGGIADDHDLVLESNLKRIRFYKMLNERMPKLFTG